MKKANCYYKWNIYEGGEDEIKSLVLNDKKEIKISALENINEKNLDFLIADQFNLR